MPDAPRRLLVENRLVLSPNEALVEGGAAEEFERRVQALFAAGHRHLVIDLGSVALIDGGGVRALVRGYTTAQRLGGSLRLTGVTAPVLAFLKTAHLDNVFTIYDSVQAAQSREWPWAAIASVGAGSALCVALVWGGMTWFVPVTTAPTTPGGVDVGAGTGSPAPQPFLELLKLVVAASIGLLVTFVHRPSPRDKPISRSLEHAQILLCVSGAMMMIVIGNNLARAFGIAGAASIIRFRTPVEDPKDVTILFLLMALGMSTGVGAFAVAGLGAAFLCVFLLILEWLPSDRRPRAMMVELVADGREFPTVHVESVFARHGIIFEPREVSQGKEAAVKYRVALDRRVSLEELSAQLTAGGTAGVKSVTWKAPKKSALDEHRA